MTRYLAWFEEVTARDVGKVGGKNASLGEMIRTLKREKISVPNGFATTAAAYWEFLKANQMNPKIQQELGKLRSKKSSFFRYYMEQKKL